MGKILTNQIVNFLLIKMTNKMVHTLLIKKNHPNHNGHVQIDLTKMTKWSF